MQTLAQPERSQGSPAKLSRRLQILVTEDAFLRIKLASARAQVSPGQLVSEVIAANLPPVVEVAA